MSTQNVKSESEVRGYVIAYDLPSENRVVYSEQNVDKEVKMKIRATRILCTTKLHKLGVLATQSVILTPPIDKETIEKVIDEVNQNYEDLNKYLKQKGLIELETPLIKVIELTKKQIEDFKVLAERKLKQQLDKGIDKLAQLINEIDTITEKEKRKKLMYNLNKQKREIERIDKITQELGIKLENEITLYIDLIDKAIDELKSEV